MDRVVSPPYFIRLFDSLAREDSEISLAFGKHVHWGLFPDPDMSLVTASDYGRAAEAMCLKMIQLAGISNGDSVLDIGCGFGGTVSCLNERYSPIEVAGLNIDINQLRSAAKAIKPRSGNQIQFLVADAARMPLADGAVDCALCVESIFHFDRPRFIEEVSRLLRHGGSLVVSDFVPDESTATLIEGMDLGNNSAVSSAYGAIDISWSITRYREFASECGLSLDHTVDVSQHTLPTYVFLQKCINDWQEKEEAKKFQRATSLLEQATRRGLIAYQLMRFEKTVS